MQLGLLFGFWKSYMLKALVLSSGGVDSTTCLALAVDKLGAENVSSVSIFYGQKHQKELQQAKKIADYYKVNHYELDLSAMFAQSNCALLKNSTQEIEESTYKEQITAHGKVNTYVPFRNGLFLASVASLAGSIYPDDKVEIYLGAHADDAAMNAYADCSMEFIEAMNRAISIGTYSQENIVAPFAGKTKADVVACGLKLEVPYELTWSCYEGKEKACGKCATCLDRLKAFKSNGVKDPLDYA